MSDVRTGKYGTVEMVPLTAHEAVGAYVAQNWGEVYSIGYIGPALCEVVGLQSTEDRRMVACFQVKASDGSMFAVFSDRYGNCGRMVGPKALKFLQKRGLEADVPVEEEI